MAHVKDFIIQEVEKQPLIYNNNIQGYTDSEKRVKVFHRISELIYAQFDGILTGL